MTKPKTSTLPNVHAIAFTNGWVKRFPQPAQTRALSASSLPHLQVFMAVLRLKADDCTLLFA
jgi:hypothetical protein